MNITVTVIDGVSGHPAEGVEVTVVGRPVEEQFLQRRGYTDEAGNFTYSPVSGQLSRGEYYTVELDVGSYFASLGISVGYKQVRILVRIVSTQADYRMGTLITPSAHATWILQ